MNTEETCFECGKTYRIKNPGSFCPHCAKERKIKAVGIPVKQYGINRRERRKQKRK